MTTIEPTDDAAEPRYGLRDPAEGDGDGRPLAEDISLPVSVTPNHNTGSARGMELASQFYKPTQRRDFPH